MSEINDRLDAILGVPFGSMKQKNLSMIPRAEREVMIVKIKRAFEKVGWAEHVGRLHGVNVVVRTCNISKLL